MFWDWTLEEERYSAKEQVMVSREDYVQAAMQRIVDFATAINVDLPAKIIKALEAAEYYNPYVRRPFDIINL